MLGIGVMTSGSVARERDRQTLESLLSVPVERRAILRAKARASVRAVRPLVWALAVFYALGVVTGGVTLLSLVVAPLLVVGWGGLALASGMWLSVRCASSTRATGYFLLGLLAVCIMPPLVGPLVAQSVTAQYSTRTTMEMWLGGFSPAVASWNAIATDRDVTFAGVTSGLGGAAAALLMALLLWRDTIRRFAIEGK
jgi:ABC-type Na+ efflux pump permease subunit